MNRAWAVIAGGGTAGHVGPALAVAEALVAGGRARADIHFVGSRRGMEATLVPAAGFPITLLPGRGINERRVTLSNVASGLALAGAGAAAMALLARLRPSVVLSVGGYAALAPALAAGLTRRPLLIHEQNAVPGAANRAAARFARACAVSLPGTPLPRAVLTGNPVGIEFLTSDRSPAGRAEARRRLGIEPGRVLMVAWGGSLGSRRINLAVRALCERWSDRSDIAVHHVVGRRDFSGWSDPAADALSYRCVEYETRMADVMIAADVAVCRAGGVTVAELALAGLPAILVPLPIATEDHQTANARALVEAGGALLVPDPELDADRLESLLGPLVADGSRRRRMAGAVSGLARPDAAADVAALMEAHARG